MLSAEDVVETESYLRAFSYKPSVTALLRYIELTVVCA
jgi:hypothetical protein